MDKLSRALAVPFRDRFRSAQILLGGIVPALLGGLAGILLASVP